ncbi:hypothetical protein SSBR45G_47260 [Bradyrhizobium sp. SSBR45G]|uniref:hypothetical protein n=1 Tax=unclassified Bradyrhizobium TaxID=2631580 RepID=UPI0023428FB1|nr:MULTISPECIES: hypothetical protein [unclassified Bradyrhizobium]GLH79817.1 hypothetical protein SSBR45G_47260 [Bradyrhizobium sp. SSBR45G]GLH87065.1 hypothetical protein SSBR45R_45250 [Bradyrhizobium sp. SSBR45R]
MPVMTPQDFAQPQHLAQEAATLLADLLGEDDGVSPLSARGRRRLRIDQLLQAEARVDAALELIALRLPRWSLRRLAYDDGEWHCALSQRRDMPDWLDHCAEARHTDLSLAILHAAVEARRLEPPLAPVSGQRSADPALATLLCCDNF